MKLYRCSLPCMVSSNSCGFLRFRYSTRIDHSSRSHHQSVQKPCAFAYSSQWEHARNPASTPVSCLSSPFNSFIFCDLILHCLQVHKCQVLLLYKVLSPSPNLSPSLAQLLCGLAVSPVACTGFIEHAPFSKTISREDLSKGSWEVIADRFLPNHGSVLYLSAVSV